MSDQVGPDHAREIAAMRKRADAALIRIRAEYIRDSLDLCRDLDRAEASCDAHRRSAITAVGRYEVFKIQQRSKPKK